MDRPMGSIFEAYWGYMERWLGLEGAEFSKGRRSGQSVGYFNRTLVGHMCWPMGRTVPTWVGGREIWG